MGFLHLLPAFEPARCGIIGESPELRRVLAKVELLRNEKAPVWLSGESGTGKSLFAQLLHESSSRAAGPFVQRALGKQAGDLLESAIFGHCKGAFTGASERKGLLLTADGGVLFLDECDDLDPYLQQRLLLVVEDGLIWPVGTDGPQKVDVRLILASKATPEELVRTERLRTDLFFRLRQTTITLPSLRERLEDLPLLVPYLLKRRGKDVVCSEAAMALLHTMRFPGNIRDLDNLVYGAALLARDVGVIGPEHIQASWVDLGPKEAPRETGPVYRIGARYMTEQEQLDAYRNWVIREVGSKAEAARVLGISRTTLYPYPNADGSPAGKRPRSGKRK